MPGGGARVRSGPTRRILQVHPTLRCNLRCGHCYSESGPQAGPGLDLDLLRPALEDARALGYETVSVSGGEPFVYPHLEALLRFAKSIGLRTGVTSNGTRLGGGRLERVREHLDGLALSVDGPPDLHDRMRAAPRAFERLLAGIEVARDCEVPLAFLHTLTEHSWEHLPWVAGFTVEQGARLLQVHPLELVGRAAPDREGDALAGGTTERAYLLLKALEAHHGGALAVQLDALLRRDVLAGPELVYGEAEEPAHPDRRPADRLGSLVIEADGAVVPISYGFSRTYAVTDLRRRGLAEAWPAWEREGLPRFRALCRSVLAEVETTEARLVNWHELVVARSHASRPLAAAPV